MDQKPNGTSATIDILVVAASLRSASLNRKLASLAADVADANDNMRVHRVDYADFDCPAYDQDAQDSAGIPSGAEAFRDRLTAADGLILASPEYNFSMPGGLKNIVDWTSRYRPHPFTGKHVLLMSASPSMAGGNRGLWALRVPFEHLGSRVYPEMFSLAQAMRAFDDDGQLADPKLRGFFHDNVNGFLDLVEAATHYPCAKRRWIEFLGEQPSAVTEQAAPAN